MGWTNERVEELKRLWDEGLTTCEIGKALGVSKNAVVGKAHRLGLQGRPSPIHRQEDESTALVETAEKKEVSTKRSSAKVAKKTAEPKAKLFTVNDLTSSSCRWPEGDPKDPDFHFCGKEALAGKPYCLEHCAVAYVSAKNLR